MRMTRPQAVSRLGSQQDTYFFSLAQAGTDCAVIGSDDNLRLFDVARLTTSHVFSGCNKGVECLKVGDDNTTLYTAGRDGLVRCWDTRSKAQVVEIKEPRSSGFSAVACRGHYVAAGTESIKEGLGEVSVHVFDSRKSATALRSYSESHTDTVTDMSWHPSQQNILLTGSTDGLVSIFDVDQPEEEDAIQQVLNPRSAVHCSGFIAEDQAYVLTTDEQFSVYGLDKTGTADDQALPMAEFGDVRSKLDCMYVVKLLQSSFMPSPVLAHGHNVDQTLKLTVLDGPDYAFSRTIDLSGAHGEEVVRDVLFAGTDTILSCGEDGQVRVWNIADADTHSTSTKKKPKKDKKHTDRFTPY